MENKTGDTGRKSVNSLPIKIISQIKRFIQGKKENKETPGICNRHFFMSEFNA